MSTRSEQKRESREAILEVAGRLVRERGLNGVGVATIMQEAGLTHGGFYGHFASRRQLMAETIRQASASGRRNFLRGLADRGGLAWVRAAVGRYLSTQHRDAPGAGCAVAVLGGDLSREDDELRRAYERELKTLAHEFRTRLGAGDGTDVDDRAFALVALCAGGVTLARAVADPQLSNRILRACRRLAERDLRDPKE